MSKAMPKDARVVIVGGGIIGCSVAYHLAHAGWKDVVLLERDRLTSGTTWHAAGLMVTFGSTSETSTEMRKYSRDLYERLEKETGQATGLKKIGFIEVAADKDRLEEYRRVSAFNRYCGVDVQEISPKEVGELFPLAKIDDLHAGFYVKDDGVVNPIDVTMALAKGARMQGVTILEETPCLGITQKNGQVTGVRTADGDIKAEFVVNCAGMWARQMGQMSGVNIPNQAAEHYYLITEDFEFPQNMPVLEDPASHCYIRQEVGGLMIGMFEPVCAPWMVEGIPQDFSFGEIQPDWDRMGPYLERAMGRVPKTLNVGLKKFFCGPESFTPDLRPIVGEAPELKNYFVAAGLNSIGILTGGGLGRVVANWIMNGVPDVDVTAMNIDRLQVYQSNPEYRRKRTVESLGMVYQCHYPYKSLQTARGAKKSPLHDRLAAAGAYFKDVSGWESPDWYAPAGREPKVEAHSFQRENWFPYWEAEHRAAREDVILMDMSFMCKFLVQGRDAGRALDHISANKVNEQTGQITYTQWLNKVGKLEADLTVTKLAEDKFFVVVTDTQLRHAETWMKRNIPADAHAFVTDVTSGFAQINIQGPRSRELIQSITTAELSNEAFPFRGAKEIDIGFARVLCIRITYLGELGYELFIPSEQAVHVYERLVEAGKNYGLRHAGLKALASLRMEKGYRDYGHDIDNTDNAFETGLGFAVSLDKPGGFIGQAEAVKQKASPLTRRLVQVLVKDPKALMFHAEVIRRNGKAVGYVRAASYGHTLGGAVGLAMVEGGNEPVNLAWLAAGSWEVEIAGTNYPCTLSLKPMYDPDNKKIKA
jgi:glycine cleavage system aminomethyltransferase T/glycine/D-amino acid oxidase-like deaminating enzyme